MLFSALEQCIRSEFHNKPNVADSSD